MENMVPDAHAEAMARFDSFTEGMDESARCALRDLLGGYGILSSSVSCAEGDVHLVMEDVSSFRRTLILRGAEGVPDAESYILTFEEGGFALQDGKYVLLAELDDFDADTLILFPFRFTDAEVRTEIFAADPEYLHAGPWEYLCDFAADILAKHILPGDPFAEEERDITPLLSELATMTVYSEISIDKMKVTSFPVLRGLIENSGFDKVSDSLTRLEESLSDDSKIKRRISRQDALLGELNRAEYEPLWRHIRESLQKSQAEYPKKRDGDVLPHPQCALRERVTELLYDHGYSGTYPDFVKTGNMASPRIGESHGMTYIVAGEKDARFFIHCRDEMIKDDISLSFLCGTALHRQGEEEPGDIFSCLFNGKGKRYCHSLPCTIPLAADNAAERLETAVSAAAKRAELKKLTKEERKLISGHTPPLPLLFLIVLFFMGGLFGIMMTVGFMVIEAVVCLITGQIGEFGALFLQTPWWIIFLFCFVSFGGIMGTLAVIAAKK